MWQFILSILKAFKKSIPVVVPPVVPPVIPIPPPVIPPPILPRQKLYLIAVSCMGIDASPNDLAPDELACAETVSTIVKKIVPDFPIVLNTIELSKVLRTRKDFIIVTDPQPGDIILVETGMGNGRLPHGHTGFIAKHGILSNDSYTGKFMENYTQASWNSRYVDLGGFRNQFYRYRG